MKVLVFAPYVPYPGIPHAGGEFLLRHLQEMARHHDVTLVVPGWHSLRRDLAKVPSWLQVVVTPYDEPGRLRHQVDRMSNVTRFRPLDSATRRGLREGGFLEHAAEADMVELQWQESAVLTRDLRRAGVSTPIAVVAHDVLSDAIASWTRNLEMRRTQRWKYTAFRRLQLWGERSDFNAADLILVFKRRDGQMLRRLGVETSTHVAEAPLDLPSGSLPERSKPALLFTGAMGRRENSDSVGWFLRFVWMNVHTIIPEATLTIVGADPPNWLRNMAADLPGVTVTGEVPALAPFYAESTAFVAPLLIAGGLHVKVVQAMAYGLPVVASTAAAAGIVEVAPPGSFWAVTDDPGEMSGAIVEMLRRPQDAALVGKAAASWCRSYHGFEASTQRVLERYEALALDHAIEGQPPFRAPGA